MLWGPMKAMRNWVAHNYKNMQRETIWDTATEDIPALLKFCEGVLAPPDNHDLKE